MCDTKYTRVGAKNDKETYSKTAGVQHSKRAANWISVCMSARVSCMCKEFNFAQYMFKPKEKKRKWNSPEKVIWLFLRKKMDPTDTFSLFTSGL